MAELTEAQAAVYDRQLRVWGVETQKRLNSARILIAGVQGLAAETAKNIVLAGVGTVTLMDSTPSASSKAGNFLAPADCDPNSSVAEVSAVTLRDMNPLVGIQVIDGMPADVTSSAALEVFDVVILLGAPLAVMEKWDLWTTEKDIAYFAASIRGPFGYLFANLHKHTYSVTKPGQTGPPESMVSEFCSLSSALTSSWSGLRRRCHSMYFHLCITLAFEKANGRAPTLEDEVALQSLASKLAQRYDKDLEKTLPWSELMDFVAAGQQLDQPAASAVVGGILAQEALKAVSQKGKPIQNFIFFSLGDCCGTIESVGC